MEKQELRNPIDKFLNEISILEINSNEYRFLNGAGWVRAKDHEDLPTNLKKQYCWELTPINESLLKQLQRSAVNELTLLSDTQLKRYLVRLSLINDFNGFFDFIKVFFVKFAAGKHTGLDIMDFKQNLESCFFTEIPTKGDFKIEFLGELQNQVFYKSGLLEGLKFQIEKLLPEIPQQTEQQPETPKRTYKTKHFILTYILDCKALNKPLYPTHKNKNEYLEKVAKEWNKYKEKPGTFRRLFYDYENEKLTENNLLSFLGDNWRSIVLQLSTDPKTLKDYLERHFV